jgi:predicted secreted protein
MNPVSGVVLFLIIWFMTLFVILPLKLKSQGEAGKIVPGTPESAPDNPQIGKRFLIVTIVSVIVFIPIAAIIISGVITIEDLDIFDRM